MNPFAVDVKRLSASGSKKWENCPASWTLKYAYGVPEKGFNQEALNFGSWIHETFEEAINANTTDVESLQKIAMDIRNKYGEMGEKLELAQPAVANFSRWFGNLMDAGCEVVGTEINFSHDLDGDDHVAFGSIDLVLHHPPSDRYLVIDFKTSKKATQERWLKDDTQMLLYATIVHDLYGASPDKIAVAHYLPHLDEQVKVAFTEKKLRSFRRRFVGRINLMREQGRLLDFKPNPLCDWCSYKELCPMMEAEPDVMQKVVELGEEIMESGENRKQAWHQMKKSGRFPV